MDQSVIDTLKKAALFSDINNKHSAALILNNRIYSIAINDIIKKIYIKQSNTDNNNNASNVLQAKITRHAEENVFYKLKMNKNVKNMDIIVIRLNVKNNTLKNSKPCINCIEKMKKYQIRKVYYSNIYGEIVSEYLNDIKTTHISRGQRENRI